MPERYSPSTCNRKCLTGCDKSWRNRGAPKNISLQLGSASQLPLADNSVNIAFYANIWHEMDDPEAAFREAARVSASKGYIAILDWRQR